MARSIRDHLRGNVVGYVALFVALTGTAMALPGRNTVDSGDIRRGAVTRSDVAANAVNGGKVADGTLTDADLEAASLDFVRAERSAGCCAVGSEELATITAYSSSNPLTFVDLGVFEIRSTAGGEPGQINVCNTDGTTHAAIVYHGGATGSTSDTRDFEAIAGGACHFVDTTPVQDAAEGDFTVLAPADEAMAMGFAGDGAGANHDVFVWDAG